jgi:hypothetical protein
MAQYYLVLWVDRKERVRRKGLRAAVNRSA